MTNASNLLKLIFLCTRRNLNRCSWHTWITIKPTATRSLPKNNNISISLSSRTIRRKIRANMCLVSALEQTSSVIKISSPLFPVVVDVKRRKWTRATSVVILLIIPQQMLLFPKTPSTTQELLKETTMSTSVEKQSRILLLRHLSSTLISINFTMCSANKMSQKLTYISLNLMAIPPLKKIR